MRKTEEAQYEIDEPVCIDIVLSIYQYNKENDSWDFTDPFTRRVSAQFAQNIRVYLREEYMVEPYINELKYYEILDVPSHPEIWEKVEQRYKRRMEGKATEEMKANAQLIAAAPEMLKELIDFCKTFESTIGYQGYDHNVFVALNDRYIKSKKAIKKALGL